MPRGVSPSQFLLLHLLQATLLQQWKGLSSLEQWQWSDNQLDFEDQEQLPPSPIAHNPGRIDSSRTQLSIPIKNMERGSHDHLHTFGSINWALFNGRSKMQYYPLNINCHNGSAIVSWANPQTSFYRRYSIQISKQYSIYMNGITYNIV